MSSSFARVRYHHRLEELHRKQLPDYKDGSLTLFRGQVLSADDLSKLQNSPGSFLAFNGFLSTTKDRKISLGFCEPDEKDDKSVGILFVVTVDTKLRSAVFADITHVGPWKIEQEVLFSIHTVFTVGSVTSLSATKRLLEVHLTWVDKDDPKLHQLTYRLEKDIGNGTDWEKLGQLLLYDGHLEKVEKLYLTLLEKKATDQQKAIYNHELGVIKDRQGRSQEAVDYYERAISIEENMISRPLSSLALSYNNIGLV